MNRRKYLYSTMGFGIGYGLINAKSARAKITQLNISDVNLHSNTDDITEMNLNLGEFIIKLNNIYNTNKDIFININATFQNDSFTILDNYSISIDKNTDVIYVHEKINKINFPNEITDNIVPEQGETNTIDITISIEHEKIQNIVENTSFDIYRNTPDNVWFDDFNDIETDSAYNKIEWDSRGSNTNNGWVYAGSEDDSYGVDDYHKERSEPEDNSHIRSDDSNSDLTMTVNSNEIEDIKDNITVKSHYIGAGDDDTSGILIYDDNSELYWMAGITNDYGFNGIATYQTGDEGGGSGNWNYREGLNSSVDSDVHTEKNFKLEYDSTDGELRFYINGEIASTHKNDNISPTSGGLVAIAQSAETIIGNNISEHGGATFDNLEIINGLE